MQLRRDVQPVLDAQGVQLYLVASERQAPRRMTQSPPRASGGAHARPSRLHKRQARAMLLPHHPMRFGVHSNNPSSRDV